MRRRLFTKAVTTEPKLSECEFGIGPAASPTVIEVLNYYERMRSYVQAEDGLINSRLTWSLTIHGFLFATYGLLLGKISDVFIEVHRGGGFPKYLKHDVQMLFIFQVVVAGMGVFVSYFSREAIVGAHNALQHLYAIAHKSGALKLAEPTVAEEIQNATRPGLILLPKIISGGARLDKTHRTSAYYLSLPAALMIAWGLLFLASLALAVRSFF